MKQSTEYTCGLCYILRIFGIPVTQQSFVYGNNHSVLCKTTALKSILKKKSNSISFHFLREGWARDEWRTTYINTHFNVAGLMTNPLAGEKRWNFVKMLQHYICTNISYSDGSWWLKRKNSLKTREWSRVCRAWTTRTRTLYLEFYIIHYLLFICCYGEKEQGINHAWSFTLDITSCNPTCWKCWKHAGFQGVFKCEAYCLVHIHIMVKW